MLATSNRQVSPPKQQRQSIKAWLKGYMSSLSDGRKPEDGLDTAYNVILSQNGTIKPAPSSLIYGVQPQGTIKGQVFPFTRLVSGVTEYWECCLMEVAGITKLYARKDGEAWTAYGTKTFPSDAVGRFDQIKQVVLIASKTDYMCWLDCATMTTVVQTALTTPTAPSLAQTGMAGTNFTYRYRYSAVNVGESQASLATTVQTSVQRDIWNPASQWVDVTLTRVTGATGYNIYYGTTAGEEVYLGYIADPGSGTLVYRDDGTIAPDSSRVAPDFDASQLPKLSYVKVLNDRPFGWGDADDQWKVWYGGVGANALKFNAFFGGGWTRVANGTRYVPNGLSMFRTGKGDPALTVFCRAFAGMGKRFIMSENTVTEGDTIITFFGVQEDNGAYGTDSPDGIVLAEDDIFYPSLDSFKKTGNKVNVPNILTSKGISDNIEVDVRALNPLYMDKCVGLYDEGRIYWSVPYGNTTVNNQIWTLDITRGGAWMLPIDISATWMWLYQDNDTGQKHFCYLTPDNEILELTYASSTVRNGEGFDTNIGSGIVKFSEDGQEWSDVEKVVYVLIRPQGNLRGSIVGKTEDAPIASVGEQAFVPNTSITGWGEFAWGEASWGELLSAPTEFGSQREELVIEVDEELQWLKYNFGSTGAGADYEVSDVIIYHTPIGIKD